MGNDIRGSCIGNLLEAAGRLPHLLQLRTNIQHSGTVRMNMIQS